MFRTVGREASVTYAIETYMRNYQWLAKFVTPTAAIRQWSGA